MNVGFVIWAFVIDSSFGFRHSSLTQKLSSNVIAGQVEAELYAEAGIPSYWRITAAGRAGRFEGGVQFFEPDQESLNTLALG